MNRCTGSNCEECARYIAEGWTCGVGTLTGQDLQYYLRSFYGIKRVPEGFWVGDTGFLRSSLILRFAVLHIAGLTSLSDLVSKFNVQVLRKLRLATLLRTYYPTLYSMLDAAFPEYKLFPWQLSTAPHGFWNQPQTVIAALQWFLDKQGWTAKECLSQLQSHPAVAYSLLKECGLNALCQSGNIFRGLASIDPQLDTRTRTELRTEQIIKRRTQGGIKCPYCHRQFRDMYKHVRMSHPNIPEEALSKIPQRLDDVTRTQSESARKRWQRIRQPRLTSHGIKVPVEQWQDTGTASLDMEGWGESLEIHPSSISLTHGVVLASTFKEDANICISLPRDLVRRIRNDVAVRHLGHNGIALRFKSDEARQLVWEWYQRRARQKTTDQQIPDGNQQWLQARGLV